MSSLSPVMKVTSLSGLQGLLDSNRRAVVDFSAPSWCVPCQRLAPHFAAAANALPDTLFIEVDVDKSPDIAKEYGVLTVPTVILFDGDEQRHIAGRTAMNLIKEIG